MKTKAFNEPAVTLDMECVTTGNFFQPCRLWSECRQRRDAIDWPQRGGQWSYLCSERYFHSGPEAAVGALRLWGRQTV